ncbi:DNA-binding protein [bacterium]|nr:DNA-binding protein [bacterium]
MTRDIPLQRIGSFLMVDLEEKQVISQLLDLYGDLLTPRQRDFLDLHYNEDLSYGEIAESANISRQAVHDAIQHGRKSIKHFEERLGLLKNKQSNSPVGVDFESVEIELNALAGLLKEDIIYNVEPLRKKIKALKLLLHISR